MSIKFFDIEFTKDGNLFDEDAKHVLISGLEGMSDLIIISHGWNNDMDEAREMYREFFSNFSQQLENDVFASLRDRNYVVVRIYWPSKRFAEDELIPGGGAATLESGNDAAVDTLLSELAIEPIRLGDRSENGFRVEKVNEIRATLPYLEDSDEAKSQFLNALRSMFSQQDLDSEDASFEMFQKPAKEIFEEMDEPVILPPAIREGGAADRDEIPAAGINDIISGAKGAARRILNFFTYYEMKQRAGVVGRNGLATLVKELRDLKPGVPIHLIGHSFGGRVVTAAAHSLPRKTDLVSLTLLQAAFSHNALSSDYDGNGNPGTFHEIIKERRISGPISITYTKNDLAVGIAYPLASRLARDKASALGDKDDPYGGMGRNGAQHLPDNIVAVIEAKPALLEYQLNEAEVNNVQADKVISNHGDIKNVAVINIFLNVIFAILQHHAKSEEA